MALYKTPSQIIAALGSSLGLATGIVRADVTMETSLSVNGAGVMSFANTTGTSRTVISGDKSRTDSDMKIQSKIVGFLARNSTGPAAEIVRLDQDLVYHLNINKKEYSETTFEQLRAQMKKASDQMNSNEEKSQPSAVDQSKCEWLPPTAEVNRTGERAQFAGYDSERVTITAKQPCKDKATGSICEVALVLDQWLSTAFSESTEAKQFYKAYATKMGVDFPSWEDASQKARSLFSQYKGVWTEIAAKMQPAKGFPVKSRFTLALGGAQCKDSRTEQPQADPAGDGMRGPSAIAGALGSKLGGLLHTKKDDVSAPVPSPEASPVMLPAGDVALMTVSSQLVSVATNAVNPDVFKVPADFRKKVSSAH